MRTFSFLCAFTISAIVTALLMTGCTIVPGPTWRDVRKDFPIWDRIERHPYQELDRLIVACVHQRGTFTHDRQACMVHGRGVCYFLTAPGDVRHDPELTAICNGWRPT